MIKASAYPYIGIITAILAIASTTSALEMSSKRDCAVCHVMWLDDFRTDKETLIKWQPGNVLMKDTQGVVSAEDNCYSCHDGYVVDSRFIVNKHKQHKTFVKPSKNVTIPSTLPLSNKDEIYCGTCHTAHGPGAPPAGDLPAPASFFRVRNIDSNLCEMCHTDQTEFKRSNSHPLKTTTLQLPDTLFESGSKEARDRNKIICQTCHKAHGAKGDKITVVDNKNSELCIICHETQKSLIDTRHDLRVSLPQEKNIKQQLSSQSGPCSACHIPHNAAGKKLWAKQLDPGIVASQMCLTCHGEDRGYKIKRIGRHSHPVNIDSAAKKLMTGDLPLFSAEGSETPTGRVQCFTCHDVHRWDPGSAADKGKKEIEGDAANSFLRMANDASSALCLTCHNDKKEVITTDHNLKITAPNAKNLKQFTARESGPCGACHIPHNAAGQRLWARRLKPGDFASQACIGCHDQNVGFPSKLIGKYSHPLGVDLLSKISITDKLPLFSANGTRNSAGKVQCFSCHDAHRWNPLGPADNIGKNLEGDGSSSFLRIASGQSSALCLACHGDKKQIIASDHNLKITATAAKNIQGFSAGVGGPCSACHIPHNAAGKRLWAQPLSGDKDYVTQLCTGCHNQNGVARAKGIGANDHPVNVSLNILGLGTPKAMQSVAAELPLYGDNGNKGFDKKIVCLTCHDPHTWDPLSSRPELNDGVKNIEGDATSSFLRKVDSPASGLCTTCHVNQARVEGTDHDLNISAPQATNLQGRTVKASGQCGACHLVHNSPHKLKLWARPYSSVAENQSPMNALCTGCHSKGNIAEKKIPLIATHPAGKLLTNVMRYNRQKTGYTPIYDETGREKNVGDISCPSCHNAHQWSPLLKGRGAGRYKFLRNTSDQTFCADCHGPDAIFRYLYFHDPRNRVGSINRQTPSTLKNFLQ